MQDATAMDEGGLPSDAGVARDGGEADAGTSVACTSVQETMRWSAAFQMPIVPLQGLAGLDIHGSTTTGLTLSEAEAFLCQSADAGDLFGDGQRVATWGGNKQVWLHYNVATKVAIGLHGFPGYSGTIVATSPDGTHSYNLPINRQLTRDGVSVVLDWADVPSFESLVDDIFRALVATFAPTLLQDPVGTTCSASQKCTHGMFGAAGFVLFKPVGVAIWVVDTGASQPIPSTPSRIDVGAPI